MQIGANIIDQWDSDNVPTFINFGGNELAGIENLPYLNKLVFKPYWTQKTTGGTTTYTFNAWLIPSLWNPHQNAPGTGTVRIAMTTGTMTVSTTSPNLGPASAPGLVCAPASWFSGTPPVGVTTYQDPEFVTLDPRTLRFGVWGNAANVSTVAADYTDGTQGTLDWPTPRYERITRLPPVGA